MLNSYPSHYNSTNNNLCRNNLNSTILLPKFRRNSCSPSTSIIISQPTFEKFNDDQFSLLPSITINSTSNSNNDTLSKTIQSNTNFFSDSKSDFSSNSSLDGLDLANNSISPTNDDNRFHDKNLSNLSTSSHISPSSQSTIQCVRVIRRNDTAPIHINSNTNQRRVVRVIRLNNTTCTNEQSSPSVYVVRKTDTKPSVQINPALKHFIAQPSRNGNNDNNDNTNENHQLNKFYGSTISIFGIEFTVVSNENNHTDKCASLVQNMNDTTTQTNITATNKVFQDYAEQM